MKQAIILPILIPLLTAILCLLSWNSRRVQRLISACGAAGLLGAGVLLLAAVRGDGIQVMQVGNWPAPFGITLAADLFSAMMVAVAGLMGLAVVVYSLESADVEHESVGYHPLLHILFLGVCGSFVTGDLFNLYVWFEVMLIASFVLLGLGGRRAQMEGAIKYVAINLIASTFFLAGIGILYGMEGTLNMADLARHLRASSYPAMVMVVAMLFLVAFGIKSAVFPLFFWLPASYHTPPVAVSAIFAGLLTKVGVYVLIRIFTLLFVQDVNFSHNLILAVAGLTMITGVLGAAAQNELRRILSFHIISQVGYMIMGLGLFTPLALAGSLFYIIHHIIVKTNLFLIGGMVVRLRGTPDLDRLGGLYRRHPGLAVLFLVPALSLAGMPPLSGFWAKLILLRAGVEKGSFLIVGVALIVGLLTLFSMTKIWAQAFWKDMPEPEEKSSDRATLSGTHHLLITPAFLLAGLTVFIGLYAAPLFDLSLEAARQLLNPESYIQAVLGES